MADPAADASGKRFDPPPSGQAALYVYRSESSGGGLTVTANQRTLGVLRRESWLRVDLPPGAQDIRCTTPATSTVGSSRMLLSVGETRYLEISFPFAGSICALSEKPGLIAQPAIRAGARVRELP